MVGDPVELNGNGGWKSKAVQWLLNQGASTVLLFAILFVLAQGLPAAWDRYEASHDRVRKDFAEVHKAQRDDLLEANKAIRDSLAEKLDRIADEVERNQ